MLTASRSVSTIMPDLISIIVKFVKFLDDVLAMSRRIGTHLIHPAENQEADGEEDQEDRPAARYGSWSASCAWPIVDRLGADIGQPLASRPRDRSAPEALPRQRAGRMTLAADGIAPPPASPPSILKAEVQPIDLTTALNLAGRPEPRLNVARTRILEAAATPATRRRLFPAIHQSRHEL